MVVIGTGNLASTATQNGAPIYRSAATSAFDFAQSVQLLTQADLSAAGITPGSTITKIAYRKTSPHTLSPGRTATYRAYAKNSTATALVNNQNFNTWIAGATLVYQNLAMDANDIPAAADSWVELTFSSPFTYTGDGLEIALDWEVNPGVGDRSTGAFLWEYTNTLTNQAVGTSSSSVITGNLTTGTARLYNCQITFLPGANCTGVNPPGQTLSNFSTACPSDNIELSVQNPTIGGGIEYQWESSIDGATWNPIIGADQENFQTSQTVATYYRAKVECVPGSVSAFTSPIFITMATGCPAFAVYNGNIGTEYNTSPTTTSISPCNGILTVNIPPFAIIDSVTVDYDMEAHNGAFMSEQRSYLRCTNPGGLAENVLDMGSGTGGIFSYNRTGLDIANNVIGGGDIHFELNAFRTWGGTTCDDFYNYVMDGTFRVLVYYTIPPMCSGQPNAGSIGGIPPLACSGSNFQLGLLGATSDLGIQYYWQMAPTPLGPWTLVDSGAVLDTVLTQNVWVRSYNVCSVSGLSDTTTAAEISLTDPLSGNYTLNQNTAASATNFTSFNELINALECGVSGPVVIEVVPNTGPYDERVEFGEIPGVSATNTITINGNGNLLTHTATNTNERAALMLNGTDYMIIDSLNIEALGTWAWGIQLMNEADHNIIKNCRIEVPISSTSTFFANVVMSGSPTGATTTGASGSFNTFENNHNIGGYYSYTMVGQSAINRSQGNKIINCVMEDMALYGVFCSQQAGTEIIGNDISRAGRNTGSTYYGIYFSSSEPAEISFNKVHDIANNLVTTTAAYPFYLTGTGGASAMNPLKMYNNICYNINSNGIQYGVYILGTSNNIDFYHNSIVLDHSGHPGVSTIAGFYHTGVATNVDLKNNIFYIDNGSSGVQYQIWFSNSTSSPTSNNNVFFNTNPSGILARRGTTNYDALIDWQPVLNNDLNSVFLDPTFAGASVGVLMPGDQLANLGATGTGVTTDIEGETRSLTSPTPGAFELKPCDSPPVPGNLDATDTLFCAGGDATLTMPNLSLGIGQTYQWQSSSDNVSWSDLVGETDPTLTVSDPALTYYRCNVTCSSVSVASGSLQVGAFPALSGTVSINQNAPASLTNFPSFQAL
ncbi:MAG: right-handed parallel beta-helix repeat-containing protein, partial [Candidatus Sumerlaeia bacterium]|nr:right-handed parallel beta-helix repeat-containing protein [Candidatus Sumerlaeia bacterium]